MRAGGMTCIVGIVDNNKAWIGGDSAGVAGLSLTVRSDAKVFTTSPFVMGFTSSFRMGQLLRYQLSPPKQPEWVGDHEFMVTVFVDAVRQCLKDGGFSESDKGVESGGCFLVGYRGRIYQIESDYQVGEAVDGYQAVGCGHDIARGALYALSKLDIEPEDRIRTALKAAVRMSAGVRGPFTILVEP